MDPSRKCLRTSDGMHLLTQCLGDRFLGLTVQPNSQRNLLSNSDQISSSLGGGGSLGLRGSCEGRLNGLHHNMEKQFRGCHVTMIVSSSMSV